MGILDKLLGTKKEYTLQELEDSNFSREELNSLTDRQKIHLVIAKTNVFMAFFEGGIKIGNALKVKGIVKRDLRTKKITTAFAFGVGDIIAQHFGVSEEDSRTCFSHYLAVKKKRDKDYVKLSNYFVKNFFKDKVLSKIADQGAQAANDLIKKRLKNKIILFSILVDKKIKI
tara:strand:+ start:90 stop:605 length:516 start_codon:yes stop_codon:yes gene_type:complete